MKISQMIEREDFYGILQRTLEKNSDILGFGVNPSERYSEKRVLYVNAQLNAIMTAKPSKEVVDYLKTEYNVGGSSLRKVAVKIYLLLATYFVKQFSQKTLNIYVPKGANNLNSVFIYPCNKKLRLFRFDENKVYTILKDGFPTIYFDRETNFRQQCNDSLVPALEKISDSVYSEEIIDGKPLARVNNVAFVKCTKDVARSAILALTERDDWRNSNEYILQLKAESLEQLKQKSEFKDIDEVALLFDSLLDPKGGELINLVMSHGDFQPGNIWIENKNRNVIVIDWETVKRRSSYYDYAALYLNMRYNPDKQVLCDAIRNDKSLQDDADYSAETKVRLVLAEELAYQTEELISFPGEIGIKEYENVLNQYKRLKI